MSYRGYDLVLFLTVLALTAVGVVMVYSSSAFIASLNPAFGSSYFFLRKHLFALGLGLLVMILAMRRDYHVWKHWAGPLLLLSFLLLLLVSVFGREIGGVKRWLSLRFLSFQPSEVAKLGLVFYLAKFASARGELIRDFKRGFLPPLIILGVLSVLILVQPNFGFAGMMLLIGFFLLFVGRAKMSHMLAILLVGVGLFLIFLRCFPYARLRLLTYVSSPEGGAGYQLKQSLLGVGSGGLAGVGLGRGRGKLLFLPQPHTDFIFATVSEELGFLGGGGLLFLFLIVLMRGVKIAKRAPDPFGFYAAIGITWMVFVCAFLHVGVVLGLLPTTGLPLPFVSYGGTSLLTSLFAAGVLLNISLQTSSQAMGRRGPLRRQRLARS